MTNGLQTADVRIKQATSRVRIPTQCNVCTCPATAIDAEDVSKSFALLPYSFQTVSVTWLAQTGKRSGDLLLMGHPGQCRL